VQEATVQALVVVIGVNTQDHPVVVHIHQKAFQLIQVVSILYVQQVFTDAYLVNATAVTAVLHM